MELTKLTKDMAIIQKLDDEPNDVGGLTADQLKAKFDEAGEAIKEYLNETLLPELGGDRAADGLGAVLNGEKMSVQDALDLLQRAVIQSGNVPVGGGTGDILQKMSDELYDLEWRPLFTSVAFTETDWTESGDGYALTFTEAEHRRCGGSFGCILRHRVDGALQSNTWAVLGTRIVYDAAQGTVTLSAADAYDGAAMFYGSGEREAPQAG